jgi:PLP dependent protein
MIRPVLLFLHFYHSMTIASNIERLRNSLPEQVTLVAVSKTKPVEDILQAYQAGQTAFGENKAQEMAAKYPLLPADINWHFIGHLQTNKVGLIAPFVSMIQSVDSLKLLVDINKEARKNHRIIPCLLQFHIAEEETKFGLTLQEAKEILSSEQYRQLTHISLSGVMGMATFTEDMEQVRREFRHLKSIFTVLKETFFTQNESFCEISMGMSDDYPVAVEEGSTMVRIGSTIFGARNLFQPFSS